MLRASNQTNTRPTRSRGFTLAETLVYAGLVAFLLVVIVQATIAVARSHDRSSTYLDVNATAMTAFSRFSRDIRRATGVDFVASTIGASPGRLVLEMKRDDGTNDIVDLYLSGSKIHVENNGVLIGDLTPSNMDVSNLTFRIFTAASTTAVRIEMTVAPDNMPDVHAVNFYGTYVLRGSYVE
ncbi:MAG: hypothetical protein Q8L64_06725 [bacterium]|nr:hypothetical protein [bacterium]